MKNGKCPKCGSTNIHSKRGGLGYSNSSSIYIYLPQSQPTSPVEYVCTSCGYVEMYIVEAARLAEIDKAWPKVPPKA